MLIAGLKPRKHRIAVVKTSQAVCFHLSEESFGTLLE
jgi:hypothetical protein